MPMYSARCDICGSNHSYMQTVANRADTPLCCSTPTTKVLDRPMIAANMWTGHKGFVAHGRDGKPQWLETSTDYNRFLNKNEFIPESEGKREAEIKAAHNVAADDQKLSNAVEQAVMANNN